MCKSQLRAPLAETKPEPCRCRPPPVCRNPKPEATPDVLRSSRPDGGFASFTGFIGLINQKQWSAAAADGQRTAWCGQVGGRCSDDMGRVRQGCGGPSVGLSNATASKQTVQQVETLATTFAKPAGTAERLASLERESPWSFRVAKTLDTCTGPHESCCEAPGDDPNNCPASARTSDCDKKKACCCG